LITFGASYQMGCWDFSFAANYAFRNTKHGKALPLETFPFNGGKVDLTYEYGVLTFGIGRAF